MELTLHLKVHSIYFFGGAKAGVIGERLVRRRGTVITLRLSSGFGEEGGGGGGAKNVRLTLPRTLAVFGPCCARAPSPARWLVFAS